MREDEVDDERRPSVMVRGSQSFHDLRGEQYPRTNRKETKEREKEREKSRLHCSDYLKIY